MTEKSEPKAAPKVAMIKVWPKPGIDVLDEYSHEPIADGTEVHYTRLTIRRINEGDLGTKPFEHHHSHDEKYGEKGRV